MALPYGVICQHTTYGLPITVTHKLGLGGIENFRHDFVEIKPYLRSMSSMSEEERKEYIKVASFDLHETINGRHYEYYYTSYVGSEDGDLLPNYDAIDWLLKNYFDFLELIPKDLAIEVTEENNPYK